MDSSVEENKRTPTWVWGIICLLPFLGLFTALGPKLNTPKRIPFSGKVFVLDENGTEQPCPDAEIRLFSQHASDFLKKEWQRKIETKTDANGRFDTKRIASKSTVYVTSADEKLAAIVEMKPEETSENRIRLYPRRTVKGRLLNRNTGKPLARTGVSISCGVVSDFGREDPFSWHQVGVGETFQRIETKTDSDGRFEFEGLISDVKYLLNYWTDREFGVSRVEGHGFWDYGTDVTVSDDENDAEPLELGDLAVNP